MGKTTPYSQIKDSILESSYLSVSEYDLLQLILKRQTTKNNGMVTILEGSFHGQLKCPERLVLAWRLIFNPLLLRTFYIFFLFLRDDSIFLLKAWRRVSPGIMSVWGALSLISFSWLSDRVLLRYWIRGLIWILENEAAYFRHNLPAVLVKVSQRPFAKSKRRRKERKKRREEPQWEQLNFLRHFLNASYAAKCFNEQSPLILTASKFWIDWFTDEENWGRERLRKLPKVT